MIVIGITGGLKSGKSTVSAMFAKLGAKVLNADKIVHDLIGKKGECVKKVVRIFGKSILSNGQIDRKKLGQIVFKDKKKLKALEGIIHPAVIKRIKSELKREEGNKERVVVLDVPLLFESGLDRIADINIVITATKKEQILRAVRELKINKRQAAARIKMQMPLKDKIRYADIIIDSGKNILTIKEEIKQIWKRIQLKIN